MKSRVDLVEVVCSSKSPLPVIVLEDVVTVSELVWVSLSFVLHKVSD